MSQSREILSQFIEGPLPAEGDSVIIGGIEFIMRGDILRQKQLDHDVQNDMAEFYDLHWKLPDAYDSQASDDFQIEIFRSMFPDFELKVPLQVRDAAAVLDAGCGSGVAGRAYFHGLLDKLTYVGVDMSAAIEQAQIEFARRKVRVALVQSEINCLPFKPDMFDFVFCPGVLHYTLDMSEAIAALARYLKPGGLFVSWIYTKQKPIRQLTDEYIRSVVSKMTPEEAFNAIGPLTKLGIALGEINQKIVVPEDIPYLDVKAGEYDLQRFFYYHIMKLFYHPSLSFSRHVVNNWNAYYPKHVLYLPAERIKELFGAAGMRVDECYEGGNGVSIIARKE